MAMSRSGQSSLGLGLKGPQMSTPFDPHSTSPAHTQSTLTGYTTAQLQQLASCQRQNLLQLQHKQSGNTSAISASGQNGNYGNQAAALRVLKAQTEADYRHLEMLKARQPPAPYGNSQQMEEEVRQMEQTARQLEWELRAAAQRASWLRTERDRRERGRRAAAQASALRVAQQQLQHAQGQGAGPGAGERALAAQGVGLPAAPRGDRPRAAVEPFSVTPPASLPSAPCKAAGDNTDNGADNQHFKSTSKCTKSTASAILEPSNLASASHAAMSEPGSFNPDPSQRQRLSDASSNTTNSNSAASVSLSINQRLKQKMHNSATSDVVPDLIPALEKATFGTKERDRVGKKDGEKLKGDSGGKEVEKSPGNTDVDRFYQHVDSDMIHIRNDTIRAAKRRSWASEMITSTHNLSTTSQTVFSTEISTSTKINGHQRSSSSNAQTGSVETTQAENTSAQNENSEFCTFENETEHIRSVLKREQLRGRTHINFGHIFGKVAGSECRPMTVLAEEDANSSSMESSSEAESCTNNASADKKNDGKVVVPKIVPTDAVAPTKKEVEIKNTATHQQQTSIPAPIIPPAPQLSEHRCSTTSTASSSVSSNSNSNAKPAPPSQKCRDTPEKPRGILKKDRGGKSKHERGKRRQRFHPLALLLDAALEGEIDVVVSSGRQLPTLSLPNDEGITALHNAICAGHLSIAIYLVSQPQCVDVNAVDADGWTPLHCAASCSSEQMVRLCVQAGAAVFAETVSESQTAAQLCEIEDEGYEGCSAYLNALESNMGTDQLNSALVYAAFDHDAAKPDEVSFASGHRFTVIERDVEKGWWLCQSESGQRGLVPRNYLAAYPRIKDRRPGDPLPSMLSNMEGVSKNGNENEFSPSSKENSPGDIGGEMEKNQPSAITLSKSASGTSDTLLTFPIASSPL